MSGADDGGGHDYVRVASVSELSAERPHQFLVDEQVRVLVQVEDGVFAFDGICTHQYAELAEGEIEDGVLWCPLHGGGFDARTGEASCLPADEALRRYDVRIEGNDVLVSRSPLTDR